MRQRSQTIGTLGRSPARQSVPQAPLPPPPDPGSPGQGAVRRWLHGALFDNTGLKFLSLILAMTVFLLVSTDKDHEINVRVPIKYDYPPDKVLISEELEDVTDTIKGPWRVLKRYDHREIGRIRLDLMTTPDAEVAITPDLVKLPPRLTVTSITPKSVKVAFDKKIEKIVEIAPATTGSVDYGYVAVATKATPAIARVRGGERSLAALSRVRTAEVDLKDKKRTFDKEVGLVPPAGVELVDKDQKVMVQVRIEEEMVIRKHTARPVEVRVEGLDPAAPNYPKFTIDPPQVEVTLSGTILALDAAEQLPIVVRVAPGETKPRHAEVVIDGLPPLVGKRISPERVTITPVAPPPKAPGAPNAPPVSPTSPAPPP